MANSVNFDQTALSRTQPPHGETNKLACAPSEVSDQPGHPPSLFRVFAVCMKKAWILSYPLSAQRRLWSDWANAQADLSLRLWSDWANAQADLSLRWAHSTVILLVLSWGSSTVSLIRVYTVYPDLCVWKLTIITVCEVFHHTCPLECQILQWNYIITMKHAQIYNSLMRLLYG